MNVPPDSPEVPEGLQDGETRYRLLVEGIPAITYIDAVDRVSTTLYTSPQVERILGYPVEEWTSDPELWIKRLHPDDHDRVIREHEESNGTGEPFRSEYRMVAKDGREVWLRDEAVLVRAEDDTPLFWRGVQLDITELKRAEERLKHSLEILRRTMEHRRILLTRLEEAQEEERRRIAADIHDDSIQVMGAVDMRLQLLARDEADAGQRRAIEEIQGTVRMAIDRLRHLLFEIVPPGLGSEGLAEALGLYLRQVSEGAFEVEVEDRLTEEPPQQVRAAAFRIAKEAITNARKHARPGRVRVIVESAAQGVLARVEDDGGGFDPEETVRRAPGHLGLSSMRERAELSGGWWRLDSAPGRGTMVEFWIPVDATGQSAGERSA